MRAHPDDARFGWLQVRASAIVGKAPSGSRKVVELGAAVVTATDQELQTLITVQPNQSSQRFCLNTVSDVHLHPPPNPTLALPKAISSRPYHNFSLK